MYRKSKIFFMQNVAPSHVGSGESLGVIDMPIQRERHTSYPKIEGSSLKGSIREIFREIAKKASNTKDFEDRINLTFGHEDKGDDYASSIGFTDARILLFPVKSVKGIFAWITSPEVLRRFKNDLTLVSDHTNQNTFNIPSVITDSNMSQCITASDTNLIVSGSNIILEEYSFKVTKKANCDDIATFIGNKLSMTDELKKRLLIIPDDDFKDFVNLSTEVITRTKIDPKTGTVKQGQLFTEEYLPTETIMYSLVLASPVFSKDDGKKLGINSEDDVMSFFTKNLPELFQIGGNATLGKGLVKVIGGRDNA
jgi:CRISPR-associated protein Cmr4